MQAEDRNNLMIGLVANLREHWDEVKGEALLYSFADEEIHQHGIAHYHSHAFPPSLMAVRTDARNGWVLVGDAHIRAEFLFPATLCLKAMHPDVGSVTGERALVEQFAKIWNPDAKPDFLQLMYRCDAVLPPPSTPTGRARKATSQDKMVLKGWMQSFFQESLHQSITESEALQKVAYSCSMGNAWVWDDDGPKAMAFITRPTPNGSCLSYVFTPRGSRMKGYAKNLVAEVTHAILTQKNFAVLYTDADFEGSNLLYRSIGYHVIAEGAKYLLP